MSPCWLLRGEIFSIDLLGCQVSAQSHVAESAPTVPAVVMSGNLEVRGRSVRADAQGRVSLNDLHAAAGGSKGKDPRHWGSLTTTKELTNALLSNVAKSDIWTESGETSVIYTKRGNNGGTFAHPVIALAYAKYLSPELHIEVNEVFLRYKAADVTLAGA